MQIFQDFFVANHVIFEYIYFSLPIFVSFISFSCLISLDTTSRLLNRSSTSRNPCLFPDHGKTFIPLPLSIISAAGFLQGLRKFLLFCSLMSVFIKNGYWIMSNTFLTVYYPFYSFLGRTLDYLKPSLFSNIDILCNSCISTIHI